MFRSVVAFTVLLAASSIVPVRAAEVSEAELTQAAKDLGARYDANYAKKDAEAMAMLYATDGILVSPAGPIIHGREALKAYYTKRFASGAKGHAIKVVEVHVQGDGGFSLAEFSVAAPKGADGNKEVKGTIAAIYRHDADGWHFSLVEPSVPEAAGR
jgi:uncharacterized protein (TIGR02246 family)